MIQFRIGFAFIFRVGGCSLTTIIPKFDLQKTLEQIDDASTELMMGSGDNVMLRLGGAMFEATEDEATEYCEAEVERQQKILDKLSEEEAGIVERQETLKKLLYGRFGKSINLEA